MYLASELSNENSALYFYTNEKFSCLTFFFWASSSNHCWAALDLAASVEQSFHCLIVQNRQALQSMRSMDWTLEDNMVDGFSFAPHSQVAEEAIPYLYMQEQKHPISVRRRLSGPTLFLGGSFRVLSGVGDENVWVLWVVRPLRIPMVIRPLRRASVVVARQTDELLCGGYKWLVSIWGAVHSHSWIYITNNTVRQWLTNCERRSKCGLFSTFLGRVTLIVANRVLCKS